MAQVHHTVRQYLQERLVRIYRNYFKKECVNVHGVLMRFDKFSFGSIQIDGVARDYDLVIEGGEIRKRKKEPSKQFHDEFGHIPLSMEEDIPWKCRRLVFGTGAHGRLPVMNEVKRPECLGLR